MNPLLGLALVSLALSDNATASQCLSWRELLKPLAVPNYLSWQEFFKPVAVLPLVSPVPPRVADGEKRQNQGCTPPCPAKELCIEARPAFERLPYPEPVPIDDFAKPVVKTPWRTLAIEDEKQYVFAASAYFPQPAFALDGNPIETVPAVIYEGMSILYRCDGTYRVRFTVTVPNTVVRIRLQLTSCPVCDHHAIPPKPCAVGDAPFTITLPPIDLRPKYDDVRELSTRTYQISHEGFSGSIRKWFMEPHRSDLAFTRSGTARFGSVPEGLTK